MGCPKLAYSLSDKPALRCVWNAADGGKTRVSWLDYGARMLDGPRWFVPDALAEKYYSISPYVYCGNNPVNMIDLLGLDPVYRDGRYYEDDGSEVDWNYVHNWILTHNGIGATYHFKSNGGRNVTIENTEDGNRGNSFYFNGKKFMANSYMTLMGRDDRNNNVGDFSTITSLSEDFILRILGHAAAVFYDRHLGGIEEGVKRESIGGLLDYKIELYRILEIDRRSLIEINGIVYNPNEAGNYLWGMVIEYFGGLVSPNWIAQTGSRIASDRDDEPWEQGAITAGRQYGLSLYKKKKDYEKGYS